MFTHAAESWLDDFNWCLGGVLAVNKPYGMSSVGRRITNDERLFKKRLKINEDWESDHDKSSGAGAGTSPALAVNSVASVLAEHFNEPGLQFAVGTRRFYSVFIASFIKNSWQSERIRLVVTFLFHYATGEIENAGRLLVYWSWRFDIRWKDISGTWQGQCCLVATQRAWTGSGVGCTRALLGRSKMAAFIEHCSFASTSKNLNVFWKYLELVHMCIKIQ